MNNTNEAEFLICGTSHALALQAKQFESSINIASYGESIQNTYFKLSHIINERKVIPDNIILSYDLGFLQKAEIDNQAYQYYWNQYENRTELIQFSDNIINFAVNRISSYLFPYKDGEVDIFDFLFAKRDKHDEALRENAKVDSLHTGKVRVLNDNCLDKNISAFGTFYFKKIISLCEYYNIELILIRFPVTSNHYYKQSKCYNPEKYYEIVKYLMFNNSELISVHDFHDLYGNEKFRDPHHLKGGEVRREFTQFVLNKINKLQSSRMP